MPGFEGARMDEAPKGSEYGWASTIAAENT
jgi:hypothetical protein